MSDPPARRPRDARQARGAGDAGGAGNASREPGAPGRPSRRALGREGERAAEAYLRARGFRILARNLVLPSGELDLVALERRALVFIEVRTRSGPGFGSPEESVTARKRRRLVRLAGEALLQRRWPPHDRVRFDVVGIDASRGAPAIRLLRDAFYLDRS